MAVFDSLLFGQNDFTVEKHRYLHNNTPDFSPASSSAILYTGVEIYQSASTPFIDFHRAANPAGDSNADYNIRLINDTNGVLRVLNIAGNDARFESNVFSVGTYVPDNSWAHFGHKDRMYVSGTSYQYMAHTNGSILVNSSNSNTGILRYNGNDTMSWGSDTIVGRGTALNDTAMHIRGLSDNNHRIEYQGGPDAMIVTMNSNIRFATTSQYVVQFTTGGEVIARFQDGNSQTRLGSWPSNGAYGGLFNQNRLNQNGSHFLHMASASDDNTFITCNSGGSSGAGTVMFRLANNGTTVAAFGNNNQNLTGSNANICLGLPNGIAGNAVNWAGGSSQVGYNVSTRKAKKNIRTLRDTPELDAGEHNPVFKMRPVRFSWKNKAHRHDDGLINADEMNTLHPNGVAGLIAEEVRAIAPDCIFIIPAFPEWHWEEGDPLPENDENGSPILYKAATEEKVTGLDHDRFIGYLVDAVQHTKELHDLHKEEIKNLKEEIKNLKKVK